MRNAAVFVLLMAVSFGCSLLAQTPAVPAPAGTLERLISAQQEAVQGGDAATIVPASRQLAAYALRLQGMIFVGQQHPMRAATALGQSFAIKPSVEVGLQLLSLQIQTGEGEAATETRKSLISLAGSTAAIYLALGNTYQRAGDLDEAIALVSTAVEVAPDSAVGHLALGSLFWKLNYQQYNPDTLREFTTAEKLDPNDLLILQNLGALLSEFREYKAAEEYLKEAIREDPSAIDPEMQLGMDLYVQQDLEGARAALERVVQLSRAQVAHERQLSRALFVLSRIADEQGRTSEADQLGAEAERARQVVAGESSGAVLNESVGVDANAVGDLNDRKEKPSAAQIPVDSGTLSEGIAARLETIAAQSLNDAGTSLARQHDYAGSLPFFEQAAAAEPDLVPVMRNLGLAAFHVQNWRIATKALGAALKQNPGDALVQRYLDEAQQHVGEVAPALH